MTSADKRLSLGERIFVVEEWLRLRKDSAIVKERFIQNFPNSVAPPRQTIHNLVKKFHDAESVLDCHRSGRPKTATSSENVDVVRTTYCIQEVQGSSKEEHHQNWKSAGVACKGVKIKELEIKFTSTVK